MKGAKSRLLRKKYPSTDSPNKVPVKQRTDGNFRYNMTKQRVPMENGMRVSAYVPASAISFLWHWKRGRFLKCNPRLIRPPNEPRNIPLSFVNHVAEFRDFCASYGVTCFLFCGSLLGMIRAVYFPLKTNAFLLLISFPSVSLSSTEKRNSAFSFLLFLSHFVGKKLKEKLK